MYYFSPKDPIFPCLLSLKAPPPLGFNSILQTYGKMNTQYRSKKPVHVKWIQQHASCFHDIDTDSSVLLQNNTKSKHDKTQAHIHSKSPPRDLLNTSVANTAAKPHNWATFDPVPQCNLNGLTSKLGYLRPVSNTAQCYK